METSLRLIVGSLLPLCLHELQKDSEDASLTIGYFKSKFPNLESYFEEEFEVVIDV